MNSIDGDDVMMVAQAAIAAASAATAPIPYTLLQTRNTPVPLKFTWARHAVYPSKLGVRKDVYALNGLIRFRAKADVLIPSGQFVYGFSAQDTLFNGRFSANIPGRVFAYEKHVGLPNGMNVAVTAGAQYVGARGLPGISFRDHFKPLCGFQLRFGGVSRGDGDVVYSGEGFSVKQRVPLPLGLLGLRYPAVDLETFTTVKIPQMTSRFSVQNDGFGLGAAPQGFGGIGGAVREDNAFCLHVQGINAVIRL